MPFWGTSKTITNGLRRNRLVLPLSIRGMELPHRIAVSPMCQYSSQDGFATDWHMVHLGSRAVGGAALVIVEASAVLPEGRITPGDMGFWKDGHIAKHRQIVDFAHSQGARIGIQLAHAGRKASMDVPWNPERALQPAQGGGRMSWRPARFASGRITRSRRHWMQRESDM